MRTILFLSPFVSFCCMHLYFIFTAVSYQMFFHWCSFIGVCEINHLTCLLVFMQPLATESECSRCALPTLPSFGENGLLLPIVPCQWHELSVGKFSCDYWMTVLRVCVKAIAQHAKSTWNTLSLFATAVKELAFLKHALHHRWMRCTCFSFSVSYWKRWRRSRRTKFLKSKIWNRTRPRALVQNQHTRDLISARNT